MQSGEKEGAGAGGAWDAEPEGSWQEDRKWVEGLNNYGYSILSSYAFTLGCSLEQRLGQCYPAAVNWT